MSSGLAEVERAAAALIADGLPARAVIGDSLCAATNGATFDNFGPRDGRVLNRVAACNRADVDLAVASARSCFEAGTWRRLPPRARKAVMLRLADLLESRLEEFALLETLDTGKPISEARAVDVPLAIGTLRYYAEAIDKIYGEVGPSGPDRLSWAVREPLGVIAALVPWNFPLHMAMWKIAPAIAMGNSIVVKPSELSPLTALRFGELALEAGLPPGVLAVVPGTGAEAGDALARHMDVDMIALTGSGATGRALMRASADSNLKRVSLELGGKSPHIVLADCPDLDLAARQAAWGVFYNQGQVCTAGSRLLVARSIRDAFLERLIAVAREITAGDPLDPAARFGALISERQLGLVAGHAARAAEEGARLCLGGERVRCESGGYFYPPTIFDRVERNSALARIEVFGPIIGVIDFDTPEEALEIANHSEFGLAAGIWTASIDTAHRFARELRSGLVWINGWDACDITMPFGGFKQSGFGRDRSLHALDQYSDLKSISMSFSA